MMLLSLVGEQVRMGHQPVIASIGEKGTGEKPLEKEAVQRGFRVRPFRMTPGPNYWGALEILRFARREKVDVLHSHGYKGNILLGLLPRRIRTLPFVTTVHGYTSAGNKLSKIYLYECVDKMSMKAADAVVLVSPRMKKLPFVQQLRESRVHVVNNGISPEVSPSANGDPAIMERLSAFRGGGFCVGAVGRLSEEKDFPSLLHAVRELINGDIPQARLLIIGEGPERQALEHLAAELDLMDRLILPGYVPNARAYMHLFDVFVICSLTEGLPITLLEAMQEQVPIVATRVGGIPEVLNNGEGGILCPPGSPEQLAEAIASIVKQPGLKSRITANARETVQTRYSIEAMAMHYNAIYEHLLLSYAS